MDVKILGTGSALPRRVVTNQELSTFLDTSDEWISGRTGIRERRIATDESFTDLIERASLEAIDMSGIKPEELDLILVATFQGDTLTPSAACRLGERIGAKCPMFDLNAACSGFLYGLDVADSYLRIGKAKKVLLVAADMMSRYLDWNDRATAVLFGDGAGAVVLTGCSIEEMKKCHEKKDSEGAGKSSSREGLLDIRLTADGNEKFMNIGADHGTSPFRTVENGKSPFMMQGQEVFRFAVSTVEKESRAAAARLGIDVDDIDYFLLHQANMRIIESARIKLKQPPEKFPTVIEKYGNCSAASVILLLDDMVKSQRIRKGDLLFLCAFGAGLTAGSALIRW